MAYTSVTYISKILWRFFGGSDPSDPKVGLHDIQFIFTKGKIVLEPFFGPNGKEDRYRRQIVFQKSSDSMVPSGQGEPLNDDEIYAEEPKAVCFCDIPINHLALHMKKYNCVGIGIDRELLAQKAKDLQPARYFFIRGAEDFETDMPGVFSVRNAEGIKTVALEKYIKIATLFRDNASVSETLASPGGRDVSEGFNSIYEEREWKHFGRVELDFNEVAFVLLPSRGYLKSAGELAKLIEAKPGIIYADELFPMGGE